MSAKTSNAKGKQDLSYLLVTAKVVMMTPERATELMERNTLNRDISQKWAEELKGFILGGRWKLTQDAVAISVTGRVLNGQHRLWAIIEAGRAVPVLLAENYQDDAQQVMDVGRKRTSFDSVKVSGRAGVTRNTVMIVQRMFGGDLKSGSSYRMANDLIGPIFDRHREAAEFSASAFKAMKSSRFHVSIMAVVARAWYTQDHERLLEFVEVMVKGVVKDKGDTAAVPLRDLIHGAKGKGGGRWSTEVYKKTERALEAFLKRKPLQRLTEVADEVFPIPA